VKFLEDELGSYAHRNTAHHEGTSATEPEPKLECLPQRRKENPPFIPLCQRGKERDFAKWRPGDAVQDMLGARMILSI
jgi:hypothetical protein